MELLSQKIDQYLIDLAWSLWNELGVAGIKRQHQNCFIGLEELIVLTAVIGDLDPRLRDEALDWCSRYHSYVSISRLRGLIKIFDPSVQRPFSLFAATLNAVSNAKWPLFEKVSPLQFVPSGKSRAPRCELPSLLLLRLRALFGVGARADLMTFCLTQETSDFTAIDAAEIGYSRRILSNIFDEFSQSGTFNMFMVRNQKKYRFVKRDLMMKIVGSFPEMIPSWKDILECILPLRLCIQNVEKKSAGSKLAGVHGTLLKIGKGLHRLNLAPPPLESDFLMYWERFSSWILNVVQSFSQGNLGVKQVLSWDEKRDAAERIKVQFEGLFSNIETLKTQLDAPSVHFLFQGYKDAFRKNLDLYLPKIRIEDQKEIRILAEALLAKERNKFDERVKEEFVRSVHEILEKYFD